MFSARIVRIFSLVLVATVSIRVAQSAQESIDSLLNKLPPPNKLVKPHVQQALEDPAVKDPLADRAIAAEARGDFGTGLTLGRQLAQKDPKSAFAHLFHGATAIDAERWPEAEQALQASITIDAGHGVSHLLLG